MVGEGVQQVLVHNRRAQYRVRPLSHDHLTLALMRGEQRLIPDEIADVTSSGASVRFQSALSLGLQNGEELQITIQSPDLGGDAVLPAVVSSLRVDQDSQLVGLSFEHAAELLEQGTQKFFKLFNRRAAERGVEPESAGDVQAVLKPLASARDHELRFPVTVRNISATGVCIGVDQSADKFLRERQQIRIAIKLLTFDESHDIAAEVRYRTVDAGNVYYGCHFDWSQTKAPLDVVEELAAYALRRFEDDYHPPSH